MKIAQNESFAVLAVASRKLKDKVPVLALSYTYPTFSKPDLMFWERMTGDQLFG